MSSRFSFNNPSQYKIHPITKSIIKGPKGAVKYTNFIKIYFLTFEAVPLIQFIDKIKIIFCINPGEHTVNWPYSTNENHLCNNLLYFNKKYKNRISNQLSNSILYLCLALNCIPSWQIWNASHSDGAPSFATHILSPCGLFT